MHAIDFLRDHSKITEKRIYVFFGDDLYLSRESLRQVRRTVLPGEDEDMAITRFAGDSATLADVIDELRTLPFFSKRRVVIVEGADKFVTAHRKELETYCEHPASGGVLVLLVKTWPSTTRLAKLVEGVGLAVECKGPHEKAIGPWLVQLAFARFQTKLDADAASLLLELVGPDVGLLVAEIEKLAVYVGARAKIHPDDVARMVNAGRVETVWKMIDAATTGKDALALEHLDGLLTSGEAPVALLGGINFSLRKVHQAGQLRRNRLDLKEACARAGIYPGAVEKTRQQHTHLGPDRVDRLPNLLLQADLDLKGASPLPPRVVLERLIVGLASPRKD